MKATATIELTDLETSVVNLLNLAERTGAQGDRELANIAHYLYTERDQHRLTKAWRVLKQLERKNVVGQDSETKLWTLHP